MLNRTLENATTNETDCFTSIYVTRAEDSNQVTLAHKLYLENELSERKLNYIVAYNCYTYINN